ncbi:hypothetical protein BSKO_13519 [Bryopsis sp. KO-2023]|nr:hypothetical protein BSKO_13519 [Bryopsis sp. KO-2023]
MTLPTCRPPKMNEIALDLSSTGTALATISVAAEGATASPIPTKDRESTSPGTVPASNGKDAVARDHNPTPDGITVLPPSLEHRYPPGAWKSR